MPGSFNKIFSTAKFRFVNNSGFTLLELIISIAITGIIFTFVLNIFNTYSVGLNDDAKAIHLSTKLYENLDAIMDKIRPADLAVSDKISELKLVRLNNLGQVQQTLCYEIIQDVNPKSEKIWLLLEKTSNNNGFSSRRVLLTNLLAPPKSQFKVINKFDGSQIVQIIVEANWENRNFYLTRVASLRNSKPMKNNGNNDDDDDDEMSEEGDKVDQE